MDWRVFVGTFGLIFLAELGDKTQLAAFAISAGSRSSWSVFWGAVAAFILSAALAVVLGLVFKKVLPMAWVQLVAGALFLIFGIFTLSAAISGLRTSSKTIPHDSIQPSLVPSLVPIEDLGVFSRLALKAAVEFEERAAEDYQKMKALSQSPQVADFFQWLSNADLLHYRIVSAIASKDIVLQSLEKETVADFENSENLFDQTAVSLVVKSPITQKQSRLDDLSLLRQAEEHEISAHQFYSNLAKIFARYAVAGHFAHLAQEELIHLEKIREMIMRIRA